MDTKGESYGDSLWVVGTYGWLLRSSRVILFSGSQWFMMCLLIGWLVDSSWSNNGFLVAVEMVSYGLHWWMKSFHNTSHESFSIGAVYFQNCWFPFPYWKRLGGDTKFVSTELPVAIDLEKNRQLLGQPQGANPDTLWCRDAQRSRRGSLDKPCSAVPLEGLACLPDRTTRRSQYTLQKYVKNKDINSIKDIMLYTNENDDMQGTCYTWERQLNPYMDRIRANHCEPLFIIANPYSNIRLAINLDH